MKALKPLSLILILIILVSALAACGDEAPLATVPPSAITTAPAATATTAAAPTTQVPTVTSAPATTQAATTQAANPTNAPATTVAATTAPAASTTVSVAQAQAIRQTKWETVLKADPKLKNEPVPSLSGAFQVTVKGADVGGNPLLDKIIYVDMDGDGIEEAALTLNSGGTAGAIGFLIYKQATPAPLLTAWQSGYKLGLSNEKGKLLVTQAIYGGWEPNCCPSGLSYTTYALKNNNLAVTAERSEGLDGSQALAVEQFYTLLSEKKLDAAYKLLSAAYRAANPYAAWSAGYANTRKIIVEATAQPNDSSTVNINLTATDATAGGGEVTKRFSGSWKVTWDSTARSWVLSNPAIKEVTSKATVHPALQPLVTTLKSKTQIPILLPGFIREVDANKPFYASIEEASATKYQVNIGAEPDCNAGACYVGTVTGEKVKAGDPALKGTTVKLNSGITGYFVDYGCGASCSSASLSWQQNGTRYIMELKAGLLKDLTKMANSAIDNGQL